MSYDLISRKEQVEFIEKHIETLKKAEADRLYIIAWQIIRDYIWDEARAVDAVEVVRCKDCIYWGLGICNLFSEEPDGRYSGNYIHTDPEAFCSYGEKEGIDYEVD